MHGTKEDTVTLTLTIDIWQEDRNSTTNTNGSPASRCQLEIERGEMQNSHVAVQDELLISNGPGEVHVCINCDNIVERAQLKRELDPLSLNLLAWDGGRLDDTSLRCSHCKQSKQWVRRVD